MSQLSRRSRNDQKSIVGQFLETLFFDHNSYLSISKTMSSEEFTDLTRHYGGSVSVTGILLNLAIIGVFLVIIGLLAISFGSLGGIIALSFGLGAALGIGLLIWARAAKTTQKR